jgi:hypothetical protein
MRDHREGHEFHFVPPKPPKIQPRFSARGPRLLSFYNCHHPGTGCPTLRAFRSVGTTDENSSHQISRKPRAPLSCAITGKATSSTRAAKASTGARNHLRRHPERSRPSGEARDLPRIATDQARLALGPKDSIPGWTVRFWVAERFQRCDEPLPSSAGASAPRLVSGSPRVPLVPLKPAAEFATTAGVIPSGAALQAKRGISRASIQEGRGVARG